MEPRSYRGVVLQGERRGAALGFPTANIALAETSVSGIYAARVKIADNEAPYGAAVYADRKRKVLEAYLLDFADELYGAEIEITLLEKIRDSEQFTDDTMLRTAIAQDIARVREYFAKTA